MTKLRVSFYIIRLFYDKKIHLSQKPYKNHGRGNYWKIYNNIAIIWKQKHQNIFFRPTPTLVTRNSNWFSQTSTSKQ